MTSNICWACVHTAPVWQFFSRSRCWQWKQPWTPLIASCVFRTQDWHKCENIKDQTYVFIQVKTEKKEGKPLLSVHTAKNQVDNSHHLMDEQSYASAACIHVPQSPKCLIPCEHTVHGLSGTNVGLKHTSQEAKDWPPNQNIQHEIHGLVI